MPLLVHLVIMVIEFIKFILLLLALLLVLSLIHPIKLGYVLNLVMFKSKKFVIILLMLILFLFVLHVHVLTNSMITGLILFSLLTILFIILEEAHITPFINSFSFHPSHNFKRTRIFLFKMID